MDYLQELRLARLPRHRKMLALRAKMRLLLALPKRLKQIAYYGKTYTCPICESKLRRFIRATGVSSRSLYCQYAFGR